jgi:radical SAM superfamily enzyme YgiQ (UPF0313 family)
MGTGIGSVAVQKQVSPDLDWEQLVDHGEPVTPHEGLPNFALFNANPFSYGIANLGAQSIAHYLLTKEINVYFAFADTISRRPFLNDATMTPLACDVIGLSVPFEDTYLNALRMLHQAGLPIYANARGDDMPLVVLGGGAMLNPLPLSAFVDIVVLGEGREAIYQIITRYRYYRSRGVSKRSILNDLIDIPGVYVPSHYHIEVDEEGYVAEFRCENNHPTVEANVPLDLSEYPIYSVWTSRYACYEFEDYFSIMAAMGCHKKCPFCIVGHVQGSKSGRAMTIDIDRIMELAFARRSKYGTNLVKIFFSSAFSPDAGDINAAAVKILLDEMKRYQFSCRVGSLNVRQADEELFQLLHDVGQREVTFAPETTEEMRPLLGKAYISDAKLHELASYARKYDFDMNIYSLGSLPYETDEQTHGLVALLRSLKQQLGTEHTLAVHYNPAFMKAQTPFQYFANTRPEEARRKLALIKPQLASAGIGLVTVIDDPMCYYQPVLALGDFNSGKVLAHLYQRAEVTEVDWMQAFHELGFDDTRYFSMKDPSRTLPWEHIQYTDHQKLKRRALALSTVAARQIPQLI